MVLLNYKEQRTRNRKQHYHFVLFFVLCFLFVGCSVEPIAVAPTPTPRPPTLPTPTTDPSIISFTNGHTVRPPFAAYWRENNGDTYFGAPLTEAHVIDDQTVQYFERARFEVGADGMVVLGQLGTEAVARRSPSTPAESRQGCEFVASTAHNICELFLRFWQEHQPDLLGAPLSEAEQLNGRWVQYFERARLEQTTDGKIVIGSLGDEALARVPAHTLLRVPGHLPASQRATLRVGKLLAQPLETVRATLETNVVSGTATVFWGDTASNVWATPVELVNGRADIEHTAQGALGQHGALVMINGQILNVTTNVFSLDASSSIVTGQPRFDELLPRVKAFMDQDVSTYTFGDRVVRGYRSPDNNLLWLRDHVHQGKGYAYWEQDMTSLLDQFRFYQRDNGMFDDYLGVFEFGEVRGRKEVEADLEYLFVEGVYRAWQATGDDEWLRRQMSAMEHGLHYAMSDPQRWDAERQLVKRPYTIDTWDFEIGAPTTSPDGKIAPRHWIDADTKWSIFHGDNTGYAQAMQLLAQMYRHLGNQDRASHWEAEARGLIERLNVVAWNGRFYRHMVPLRPLELPFDPEPQLSLSNAYALNRNVLSQQQAEAVIDEYQSRRRPADQAFAEWYSIDPPFPIGLSSIPEWGQGHRPGEYVNGGIMPLVGGELAQGAFRYGYEGYGFDILQRYYSLIAGTGASYLWYHPLGQPGISGADTLPTDGWGSSAMLAALVEGAAGIYDETKAFENVMLAPRWTASPDVQTATVTIRYGASDGYIAYRWQREDQGLRLQWTGSGEAVNLHLLLPDNAPREIMVEVNGHSQPATRSVVRSSQYLDVALPATGELIVTW